jgi:hypothetical protein
VKIVFKEQGEDFYGEVDQFKLVQMLVNQFCFVEGNFQTYGQFLASSIYF